MKVAIVHDWLTTFAGAEQVLKHLLELYPNADLFAIVDFLPESDRSFLEGTKIYTSFIQKLPFAKSKYRHYLPLMPLAVEQFNLSCYDMVISSSHAVAKGVITGPNQKHLSYVHTPMRYAWDLQHQYLKESKLEKGIKSFWVRYLLHRLRIWDVRTSNGVDVFVTNSDFVAKRVWKSYRRESTTIYPPVDIDRFLMREDKEDFYLVASRMVPYKRVDLVVKAFTELPEKKLLVIGDGPEFKKIKSIANQFSNIEFLGRLPSSELIEKMQAAKAFVFAAEEDFGIMPVEAMACGTPVIAYGKGGVLETVVDGSTGLFFFEQSSDSIKQTVQRFEGIKFSSSQCRHQAEFFSVAAFKSQLSKVVNELSSS